MKPRPGTDSPLTTGEVAAVFGVTRLTVLRWARQGRIPHFRTPGGRGHLRFSPRDINYLREHGWPEEEKTPEP